MKNKHLFNYLILLCLPCLLVACRSEKFGAGVNSTAPQVQVEDVFLKPELMGKTVTVQGTIDSQCQSNGCWFIIKDATGQLYIDLSQNNLTLPARTGMKAKASGIVAKSQNTLLLLSTGVEVK